MKKLVVLFLSILIFTHANTMAKSCAHQCYIFHIDEKETPVVATPEAFRPMGGHSENMNEICVAKLNHKGEILTFVVNDIFSKELSLSIRKSGDLLAAGNFNGSFGAISFYPKKIRFSCRR